MDQPNTDLIQGTLDMLILKSLSLEPMHGFGIARRIERVSRSLQSESRSLPRRSSGWSAWVGWIPSGGKPRIRAGRRSIG